MDSDLHGPAENSRQAIVGYKIQWIIVLPVYSFDLRTYYEYELSTNRGQFRHEPENHSGENWRMNRMLDKIALALVIIGAIVWGGIGLFEFDIIAWIFGGQSAMISRIIYTLVALAGVWCISLFFKRNTVIDGE